VEEGGKAKSKEAAPYSFPDAILKSVPHNFSRFLKTIRDGGDNDERKQASAHQIMAKQSVVTGTKTKRLKPRF